jgi:hypothetical protein
MVVPAPKMKVCRRSSLSVTAVEVTEQVDSQLSGRQISQLSSPETTSMIKRRPKLTRNHSWDPTKMGKKPERIEANVQRAPIRGNGLRGRMSTLVTHAPEPTYNSEQGVQSQPIPFLEILMNVNGDGKNQNATKKKKRRSSLLTTARASKTVRFATNAVSDKVWCLMRTFEKIPESYRRELWWNEEDLDRRCDHDSEIATLVEDDYKTILRAAYKSSKEEGATVETIDMCFVTMQVCSIARGLEVEVFDPFMRDYKKLHRRAVMKKQEQIRKEGFCQLDTELNAIREQSIKFSRPQGLVARKIAEFDSLAVLE